MGIQRWVSTSCQGTGIEVRVAIYAKKLNFCPGLPFHAQKVELGSELPFYVKKPKFGPGLPFHAMKLEFGSGLPFHAKDFKLGPGFLFYAEEFQFRAGLPFHAMYVCVAWLEAMASPGRHV